MTGAAEDGVSARLLALGQTLVYIACLTLTRAGLATGSWLTGRMKA